MRKVFGAARGKSRFQIILRGIDNIDEGNIILNATSSALACYTYRYMKFCSPPPVDFR
jgi:hypothetical protein